MQAAGCPRTDAGRPPRNFAPPPEGRASGAGTRYRDAPRETPGRPSAARVPRRSMAKAMLINVTHAEESRVAIVENGVLDTFEIETLNRESIKGNVYNGTVEGINTTLNAAFVRYSNDRP